MVPMPLNLLRAAEPEQRCPSVSRHPAAARLEDVGKTEDGRQGLLDEEPRKKEKATGNRSLPLQVAGPHEWCE